MTLPQTESLRFRERDGVPVVVFPALEAVPFVRHGFSTRLGGVSQGIYASMNLSFTRGDDPCAVRENFDRFCSAVGVLADRVVVSAQEHHTMIYNATAADCGRGITRDRGYEDVDGLLTDEPGAVFRRSRPAGGGNFPFRLERNGRADRRGDGGADVRGLRLPPSGYSGGDRPVHRALLL